jgi:hypothetical protein
MKTIDTAFYITMWTILNTWFWSFHMKGIDVIGMYEKWWFMPYVISAICIYSFGVICILFWREEL